MERPTAACCSSRWRPRGSPRVTGRSANSLKRQFGEQVFGHFGAEIHRYKKEARERTHRSRAFIVTAIDSIRAPLDHERQLLL